VLLDEFTSKIILFLACGVSLTHVNSVFIHLFQPQTSLLTPRSFLCLVSHRQWPLETRCSNEGTLFLAQNWRRPVGTLPQSLAKQGNSRKLIHCTPITRIPLNIGKIKQLAQRCIRRIFSSLNELSLLCVTLRGSVESYQRRGGQWKFPIFTVEETAGSYLLLAARKLYTYITSEKTATFTAMRTSNLENFNFLRQFL
jgi:hypothetical protein